MTIPSSISRVSFLLLLACGLVVVTGCDNAGSNGDSGTTYTASLSALNSSGVSGTADVTVRDGQFTVTVDAVSTIRLRRAPP
jgi:ABC-type transporter Mla subunit MlaD